MKHSLFLAALVTGCFCFSPCTYSQNVQSTQAQSENVDVLGTHVQQGDFGIYQSTVGLTTTRQNKKLVSFVRFKKIADSKKKTIQEDAAVLNHMISKDLLFKNTRSAMGLRFAQTFGKNEIVYDDHGLRFTYNVPMILVPSEQTSAAESEGEPKSDWEKAKEELNGVVIRTPIASGISVDATLPPARLKYSKDYVDQITKQIRIAMNNSGNIRDLDEDDTITVLVYGGSNMQSHRSVLGWRVKWKNVKDGQTGLEASLEEIRYIETDPSKPSRYTVQGSTK